MRKKNIQKSNRKSKERKLLAATFVLAALIVGGSTFAWFTSEDTVTNKLSSKGGLKVLITEDFDRPDNWTPGVKVTKEVGAINAGNLDAFVRLSLPATNANITRLADSDDVVADDITIPDKAKELSDVEADAMEAGAYLVFAKNAAVSDPQEQSIRSESYKPTENGLYIFRRNASSSVDNESTTYTYAGYVYKDSKYYMISNVTKNSAKYVTETTQFESPVIDYSYVNTPDGEGKTNYISVTYGTGVNQIKVIINVDKDELKNWTFNDTDKTFYYNYVLASGKTTNKLIKSVELKAAQEAYYAFDYNLDVKVDAIQVGTGDANGNKTANEEADIVVPVNASWKTSAKLEAEYSYGGDSKYNPSSSEGTNDSVTWNEVS